MCRGSFSRPIFVPVVDKKLQAIIAKELPKEYSETKAELIASGNYNTHRLVRFTYGNTYEYVDYPQAKDGSGKSNKWTMELSINDGKENVGKYI